MPKHKIAIGITSGNHSVHPAMPVSLVKMMSGKDWSNYQLDVIYHNSIYIEMNRNNIVSDFMQLEEWADYDYLFFWDHDNGLYPEAFDIYMEDMENEDVNILSGLYYRKNEKMLSVAGIRYPHMDAYTVDTYMFLSAGLVDLTNYNGSIRGMLGTGCMMIKRDVFNNVEYPWFETELKKSDSMGTWGFSTEDTYFCEKAQDAGYHVHLDTRIRSPHYFQHLCFPPEWKQFDLANEAAERRKLNQPDVEVPTITLDYRKDVENAA